MNLESANTLLCQAWSDRLNRRIERSAQGLVDAQVEAGWEVLAPDFVASQPLGQARELYVEALLLKESLYRAQGRERQSSRWLRRVLQASDQHLSTRGFRLLFELAMDHWVSEDIAQALEYFLLAERKARSLSERAFARFNVLLCLESLDLPRAEAEEGMLEILDKIEEQGLAASIANVKEQWEAYKLRKTFYQSMELLTPKEQSLGGQAAFFCSWVGLLPYMNLKAKPIFTIDLALWQGGYRARTLNLLWSPVDREPIRVQDAIERLYLWTWRQPPPNE